MHKILLTGLLLIFASGIDNAISQTSPAGGAPAGGPAGGSGTGQAPSPLDFPQYIVTPSEDLDQFENTRVKRTKTKYREGHSTLTKPLTQKSNIEVNAEIEKRRAERQKAQEERIKAQREAAGADVSAVADTGISDLNVTGPSSLYQWRDKDGILHVTDDLGSVPPEYRDQAYKNSQ